MNKNVTLPANLFGVTVMLAAIALVLAVPFVLVLWLVMKIAPVWVAMPLAFCASFYSFFKLVRINAGVER